MRKILLLSFLAFIVASCSNSQPEVVVYTSVDQVFSEPILKDFEKETGIKVKAIYDTEETKSTGVLNRLIAEKDNPQCDLFWSGDPIRAIVLKNKGITQAYHSSIADEIPSVYKDCAHQWTGFSARARVLIYNKELMNDDTPGSILDFIKPKFKGKIAIANPLFGTTTFHIAALFAYMGDAKAKDFLTALKENEIVIATSNGDVKKRVVSGEVACGLTDTDDAYEAIKEGANIGIVFMDQGPLMGTLVMPNALCLIKNSPNSENAKKLADYLLSKQTEAKLAVSCGQMPLHKGVEMPEHLPSLDLIKPMQIDYDLTAKKLQEIQPYLKNWLEN